MPRWINPDNRREVRWARYVVLNSRLFHPNPGQQESISEVITVSGANEVLWVDPTSPVHRERQRILVWHSLLGEESESLEPSAAL
jgi:hypothetical protein